MSLAYGGGISDANFTNAKLYLDTTPLGTYNNGDIQYGNSLVQPINGILNFQNINGLTIKQLQKTNILITINHKALTTGMSVKAYVMTNYITGKGSYTTNYISQHKHFNRGIETCWWHTDYFRIYKHTISAINH